MSPQLSVLKNGFVVSAAIGMLANIATAIPVSGLEKRDVYTPPVTYPHAGTVWYKGQRHNVTWDTANHPVNITNKLGRIWLRKGDITTPVILGENFDILLGRIEVTVPWVIPDTDYSLVLFGDSGNFSPQFSIQE
ncbi:hypothetical protein BN946_scf184985.g29 [Trametes cinnabarina]|uniref:Uncharacterized protein n=1 Tax=Pycnoporus cinnabarinus TaxID=5643 RepID=A0A060SE12_PYCCI|nr:hypothetical protein BN946_scf184985.g29 [Trametes cinnabarina]